MIGRRFAIAWGVGRERYTEALQALRGNGATEARGALRDLIGMVDQMDRRPSAGGGVLPIDKARIMYRARKAAGQ